MPRKKTFTVEYALTKALDLFRTRGYRATSMRDIAMHIGVSRSSVYATFGDKHALFLQALRHDGTLCRTPGLAALAESAAPRQAIVNVFESAVAVAVEGRARNDCLLINTAMELLPNDREVAAIVEGALLELEGNFRTAVERGIASADISRQVDATQTARSLLSLFLGLQVLVRSRPDEPLLRAVVHQAGALLPSA